MTLLVDDCELSELNTVGEGKHLRFRVRQRGRDAGSAIAFGQGSQLDRFRRVGRYDVAFRLQENRWNGTVSPQLVVRRIFDASERFEELRGWLAQEWARQEAARSPEARAIFAELELVDGERRSLLESEIVPAAARRAAACEGGLASKKTAGALGPRRSVLRRAVGASCFLRRSAGSRSSHNRPDLRRMGC